MRQKILLLIFVVIISISLAISYIENFLTPLNLSSGKIVFSLIYLSLLFTLIIYWLMNKLFLPKFMILQNWKRIVLLVAAFLLAIFFISFRNEDAGLSIKKIYADKDFLNLTILFFIFIFFGALLFRDFSSLISRFFSDGTQSLYHWKNPKLYLISFIIVYLLINTYWLIENTAPPWWDQSWYLQNSEFFYNSLRGDGIISFAKTFVDSFGAKAPLIALLPLPWYLLGFHNYLGVVLTLLTLTFFFFIVFYKLISKILGPWIALIAVIITGTMPLTYGLSRQFMVEFGLMLFVTLWILLQVFSDHFENSKYNFALGCVLGLGMLMKTTFPIYILGPIIISGIYFLRFKSIHQLPINTYLKNVSVIFLIGALISSTWYLKNFSQVFSFGLSAGLGDLAKDYSMGDPLDFNTILSFWKIVINVGISAYYFFIGIAFLGLVILRKVFSHHSPHNPVTTWENKGLLLLWPLFPFVVFSLGVNKDYRYLLPTLPALSALIATVIFTGIRSPKFRSLLIPLALIFPLCLMLYTSFRLPINQNISLLGFDWVSDRFGGYAYRPKSEKWPISDIIGWIDEDAKTSFDANQVPNPLVVLIVDHMYFNYNNFGYYSTHMRSNILISGLLTRSEKQWQEQKRNLDYAQYIITKTGDQGPSFTTNMNLQIQESLQVKEFPFVDVKQFNLPDGSEANIYRRY